MQNKISGLESSWLPCDVEGALVTIDFGHHEIHEGEGYFVSNYVASKASYSWLIRTPDSAKRFHLKLEVDAEQAGVVQFYSGASPSITVSETGTTFNPVNCDLNLSNSSTLHLRYNTKATGAGGNGTLLKIRTIGGNVKKVGLGGSVRSDFELILKQNTPYLLKWSSETAGTVDMVAEWYEV